MRLLSRRRSLALIGAALLLPDCGAKRSTAVRIGSKSSPESATIAEIYAVALEREHMPVERHMNLGDANTAVAALERGDIDLYPEYVDAGRNNNGVMYLDASPVNESPCLATSQYIAEQYSLLTLTKCARLAPKLRFAVTPGFLARDGALKKLQHHYGGFQFKKIVVCRSGAQYYTLNRGEADVAGAFTTDPEVAEDQLIVLADDKRFWPRRNIAPLTRLATIHAHPRIAQILNRISPRLTDFTMQQLNMRRDLLHMDARDIAEEFVTANMPVRFSEDRRMR